MGRRYLKGHEFGRGPRVVYLTNQLPWPARSGGQVREAELLSRVGDSADVELFVLTQHFERDVAHMQRAVDHCTGVHVFESDVGLGATIPRSAVPERVWSYQSSSFDTHLAAHLRANHIDLVHVEGYFLLSHLSNELDVPISLTEENIEYELDREHAETGVLRGAPWKSSRTLERSAWARASRVLALAEQDSQVISETIGAGRVGLSPDGFDHLERPGLPMVGDGNRAIFVGNYSWAPSRDAARELIGEIWPRINDLLGDARLSLVGAGLSEELRAAAGMSPTIDVIGEVDSVLPPLHQSDVFLCPTRTGSGVKVKMLEALHVGCAVVCTQGALRGLPGSAGRAVLVADDPRAFANAAVQLLETPSLRRELVERGRTVIKELPSWDQAAHMLLSEWHLAIAQAGGTQ